jgi:hypothetical protein
MYDNRILPRLAVKLLVYEKFIFHLLRLYIIYHMNVVAVVEKAFACLKLPFAEAEKNGHGWLLDGYQDC